jgi:hypothetical protein
VTDPTILAAKLDELIAVTKANSVPLREQWRDCHGIGALLDLAGRTVLEEYAPRPDFPKPWRDGQPRWNVGEVLDWVRDRRNTAQPRRRRAA